MKEEKQLYCVSGYIPSDENKVVMNVYQQFKIGNGDEHGYKYCWADIKSGSGIGFRLSFGKQFEDNIEDSIIMFLKVVADDYMKIDKMTFDEMIICYKEMEEKISKELNNKKLPKND